MKYPAHLVFSFHIHSAFFAALLAAALVEPIGNLPLLVLVQVALLVYSTWYLIVACRAALGGSTRAIVLRTTVVGLLYTPVVLVAVVGATVIAINAL